MKNFDIFNSPLHGNTVVKKGWSWPGFLFCWIWMMVKGMWVTFAFTMLAIIILVSIVPEQSSRALALVVNLIVGIFGNEWRVKELLRKGYTMMDTVSAGTAEQALSLYLNNTIGKEIK